MMYMKRIFAGIGQMLLAIVGLWTMGGCEQNNYLQYDGQMASLRFEYPANGTDSVVYSFALRPGTDEGEVEVPVRLIGLAADYDRTFVVEVVKEATTAKENVDFEVVQCMLEAGSVNGTMKVKVKKNATLDSKDLAVTLRLGRNEHFTAAPVNERDFRIVLTAQLAEPADWPFGEYSRIKHEFVITVTGVGTDYGRWNTSDKIYWTGKLNEALYEYNKAHPDNLLRDEHGMLITF